MPDRRFGLVGTALCAFAHPTPLKSWRYKWSSKTQRTSVASEGADVRSIRERLDDQLR
jgi:hypothetical protein